MPCLVLQRPSASVRQTQTPAQHSCLHLHMNLLSRLTWQARHCTVCSSLVRSLSLCVGHLLLLPRHVVLASCQQDRQCSRAIQINRQLLQKHQEELSQLFLDRYMATVKCNLHRRPAAKYAKGSAASATSFDKGGAAHTLPLVPASQRLCLC